MAEICMKKCVLLSVTIVIGGIMCDTHTKMSLKCFLPNNNDYMARHITLLRTQIYKSMKIKNWETITTVKHNI